MLSVEQIKYYGFTAWQAGFKVLIHDQGTPPMIEELGFSVGPGTSTFAAIKKLKVRYTIMLFSASWYRYREILKPVLKIAKKYW